MSEKDFNSMIDGIIAQLQLLKMGTAAEDETAPEKAPAAVPSVMTIPEAADFSGFSAYFIRRLCRENKLKHVNSGKKIYIQTASLKEYADRI